MKFIWEFLNQLLYQYRGGENDITCGMQLFVGDTARPVQRTFFRRAAFAWQCTRMQKAYDSLLNDPSYENHRAVFKKAGR